jgi:hypothetical protein
VYQTDGDADVRDGALTGMPGLRLPDSSFPGKADVAAGQDCIHRVGRRCVDGASCRDGRLVVMLAAASRLWLYVAGALTDFGRAASTGQI